MWIHPDDAVLDERRQPGQPAWRGPEHVSPEVVELRSVGRVLEPRRRWAVDDLLSVLRTAGQQRDGLPRRVRDDIRVDVRERDDAPGPDVSKLSYAHPVGTEAVVDEEEADRPGAYDDEGEHPGENQERAP